MEENRIDELKAALWSSDPWVADNHSFFCLHCGMKYNGDVPQGTHHANCIWLVNFQEVESGLTPRALDGGESAANLSLFPAEVQPPAKVTRKSTRQ